ncbi:unnamed protein product [Protopolystoma xenopodis]|uniref:Uncharacterized protein n=1 Tax=Protopolystoma xenopodis TaxID=117903 RepID=A0A448WLS5_9PLAT|nr:unnamed protein product [Protopolystoma xenopodis]
MNLDQVSEKHRSGSSDPTGYAEARSHETATRRSIHNSIWTKDCAVIPSTDSSASANANFEAVVEADVDVEVAAGRPFAESETSATGMSVMRQRDSNSRLHGQRAGGCRAEMEGAVRHVAENMDCDELKSGWWLTK